MRPREAKLDTRRQPHRRVDVPHARQTMSTSGSKNVHVLMITTPGRRTGIPRSTCVRYLETPAGLVVWGTGSGSPRDPDWFQNLRRRPRRPRPGARRESSRCGTHELHGEERDAVWRDVILAEAPQVSRYAQKAVAPSPWPCSNRPRA